ncbi:MAG TPA: cupredoxin domain-containing protein [Edaphocola sp.]|nr:cupredoxin domain-containing protein [Edaphocola sp.]
MLKRFFKVGLALIWVMFVLSACNSRTESGDTVPSVDTASVVPTPEPKDTTNKSTLVDTTKTQEDTKQVETDKKGKTIHVTIEEMKFNPETVEAHKGDEIVFTNKDIVPHDITDEKKSYKSPTLNPDDTWKLKVEKSSNYYCSIHLVMKGKIIVK